MTSEKDCNHMIGIIQELHHNYEWPLYDNDDINVDGLMMIKFKYCPLCGVLLGGIDTVQGVPSSYE